MFRNSNTSSRQSGSSLGFPPPPPPSARPSTDSVAVSELSASGLIDFSENSLEENGRVVRVSSADQESARLLNPTKEEEEDREEGDSTSKSTNNNINQSSSKQQKKTTSFMARICKEVQCCLPDDDPDEELNPFSKRRLVFIFFIVVLAVVLNLVVIPISLTNMEKRSLERQQALNQTPTSEPLPFSDMPSISPYPTNLPSQEPTLNPTQSAQPSSQPSQTPSFSPTQEGQTRPPTPRPTASPTSTPTSDPTDAPTPIPTTSAPVERPTTTTTTRPPSEPVAVALPSYTIQALDDPNSPQSKAFQWLTSDPNFNTYTSSRQLQRMALSTFFFATNQDLTNNNGIDPDIANNLFTPYHLDNIYTTWYSASDWLSYDIHECFWFSQAPFVCDTQQRVRYVQLEDNGLVGTLPPEIALLTLLEGIDVSRNSGLYGSIPSQMGDLTKLASLQMSYLSQLSGTIPYTLGGLHTSLIHLKLQETPYLSKLLSTQLGRLTRLQELRLDARFSAGQGATTRTGTLPTEVGNLRALRSFSITGQELVGSLPTELAQLTWLEHALISQTQIGGPIPGAYGDLGSLTSLELTHNALTSTLPLSLGQLSNTLQVLKLNSNQLTGTIPSQYSSLTNCQTMSFQKNDLTGQVPNGLCDLLQSEQNLVFLDVDCGNGGQVACDCDCICF